VTQSTGKKPIKRLSGGRQRQLREWLGLTLPQFAAMTTESMATHSRREQHDAPLTGPTEALVLILDYLYELREGPEREKVAQLQQQLATDPTRRHFLGRFGAAVLMRMMQDAGLPSESLSERVQLWCEQDHQQALEKAATGQLQKTVGFDVTFLGGLLAAAVAGLSWAWVESFLSSPPLLESQKIPQKGRNIDRVGSPSYNSSKRKEGTQTEIIQLSAPASQKPADREHRDLRPASLQRKNAE